MVAFALISAPVTVNILMQCCTIGDDRSWDEPSNALLSSCRYSQLAGKHRGCSEGKGGKPGLVSWELHKRRDVDAVLLCTGICGKGIRGIELLFVASCRATDVFTSAATGLTSPEISSATRINAAF